MSKYGTQFVETEALLAEMNQDQDMLEYILCGMLPGELLQLNNYLANMIKAINTEVHDRCISSFTCSLCGPRVRADEDGCCATCGADCIL